MMKAILIGATGLVGSEILKQLLSDTRFSEIHVFTRHSTEISHPKLREIIVDFEKLTAWEAQISGDVLFSALGTTLKQSGSQQAQYRIDHDYQLQVATAAKKNGVQKIVLISSASANPHSKIFYLRMKGQLETHIAALGFDKTCFIQPGPLEGPRNHPRLTEKISLALLHCLPKIPGTEKFWPIKAADVAHVCIESAVKEEKGIYRLDPKEIFAQIKKK